MSRRIAYVRRSKDTDPPPIREPNRNSLAVNNKHDVNQKIIKIRKNHKRVKDGDCNLDLLNISDDENINVADIADNFCESVNQKVQDEQEHIQYKKDLLVRKPKPHDKYHTMKTSIASILIDDVDGTNSTILFDAVTRTHKIVIHVTMFLRLYILNKYHNNQQIPLINKDLISMAIKALTKTSIAGPKPKGSNLALFNEFLAFYESDYRYLGYDTKISAVNLSQILAYMETDILTNIENNIKMHFKSYVNRFVNSSFKPNHNILLDTATKGTKTVLHKELNKDLYEIKQDLFNNTLNSKCKYHDWINAHRPNIFFADIDKAGIFDYDLEHNPQKYLKPMIYMCIQLEKKNCKSFQFFPLRTDIVPKYIPIDTASIIDLFVYNDKNTYLSDIDHYKYQLWNECFDLSNSIFKQKKYAFDYRISTDGFAISIQLINKDDIGHNNKIKNNKKDARHQVKIDCDGKTQKEKEDYKQQKKKDKDDKQLQAKLEKKKIADDKRAAIKQLSKEEQTKLQEQKRDDRHIEKMTAPIEFPHLEDLNDNEYEKLQESNWAVVDPGRRSPLYIRNVKGNTFEYTNGAHLSKTKRIKYQKLIKNYKDTNGIIKIEKELAGFNSKSCDYEKYKEYIAKKNEVNEDLLKMYEAQVFRQYKWYGIINRKKAETALINEIKKKFGKDVILIFGDWSTGHQMRGQISTPGIGLKRKIAEQLTVYNLDEFRTSCLNYKTLERSENLYLPDKRGRIKKMHSILTYKMENNRKGCINRDNNASRNMIKIVLQYLKDRTRPQAFRRDVKPGDIERPIRKRDMKQEFMYDKVIPIYI